MKSTSSRALRTCTKKLGPNAERVLSPSRLALRATTARKRTLPRPQRGIACSTRVQYARAHNKQKTFGPKQFMNMYVLLSLETQNKKEQ
eukprot:6220062-Amphidinium_carterae.1